MPEFCAVIFAGAGSRLYPFSADESVPKALLPVANRPMLSWVLAWLDSSVTQVAVMCSSKHGARIGAFLKAYCEANPGRPKPELLAEAAAGPGSSAGGTAEVLRAALRSGALNTGHRSLIVLPCDLTTDAPFHHISDLHRLQSSLLTAVFMDRAPSSEPSQPGAAESMPRDFLALDGTRIVSLCSSADLDGPSLPFKLSTLTAHPHLKLSSALLDCHIYILSPAAVAFLLGEKGERICALKPELVQAMVKAFPDQVHAYVSCGTGYCIRAADINGWLEANRIMAKLAPIKTGKDVVLGAKASAMRGLTSQVSVSADSLLGDGVVVGEKSSIKKCILGPGCSIGAGSKLLNCLLLEGVVVEDGVKLEGCVVGLKAIVREKAALSGCKVSNGFVVEREAVAKGEIFEARLMECD